MNDTGFCLNVDGDSRQLLDAIRDYDWGAPDDKAVQQQYFNAILSSRMVTFEDDPDSPVSMRCEIDCLPVLAELIRRWERVADSLELWAFGKSDTAAFSVGIIQGDNKTKLVLARCKSALFDRQGKLAEAAIEAKRIIENAMKALEAAHDAE